MLEKPQLPESYIVECLQTEYGLRVAELFFLPIGADVNTAVFRVEGANQQTYFLKLRKGDFSEVTVQLPKFLAQNGNQAIIPPLPAQSQVLWVECAEYKAILYPFIPGQDAYQCPLTHDQWIEFGQALHQLHSTRLPAGLGKSIPSEVFPSNCRAMVRSFQRMVATSSFTDPVATELVDFMLQHQARITHTVQRAERLAQQLPQANLEFVLCHSDIHPGNLHITPTGQMFIVDWDNPIFAPPERDLLLIGGCSTWGDPMLKSWFFQGYGAASLNQEALAYYRYERILADFAAFGQQLLLSSEGGEDRKQSLAWFKSNFLPGHELDFAEAADPNPGSM